MKEITYKFKVTSKDIVQITKPFKTVVIYNFLFKYCDWWHI